MSNRSLLEFNHDRCPPWDDDTKVLEWAYHLRAYLSSGHPPDLPNGVTFFNIRNHNHPCPLGEPPRGWDNDKEPSDIFDVAPLSEELLESQGWKRSHKRTFEYDHHGLAFSIWRSSTGPWWCIDLETETLPIHLTRWGQLRRLLMGFEPDSEA